MNDRLTEDDAELRRLIRQLERSLSQLGSLTPEQLPWAVETLLTSADVDRPVRLAISMDVRQKLAMRQK